jgi:hypothetical protein
MKGELIHLERRQSMPKSHIRRYQRILAAVVAFCYFWLSTIVACQHTTHELHDIALAARMSSATSRHSGSERAFPLACAIRSVQKVSGSNHCLACEWQAVSVSPALAAFQLVLSAPVAPRIASASIRCLSQAAPSGSSRAPPLA